MSDPKTKSSTKFGHNTLPNGKLDDFQLEEYKNISNAHFESNKQIGIFFRYYLLIASTPAVIFVWFGKEDGFLYGLLNGNDTIKNFFIGSFLIIVALIGMVSCFYLISLKLDNILYARAINGIRRYFFRKEIEYEDHYRILPKHTNQPKYGDFHTFGVIVISIALINSIYFALGTRIIASVGFDLFTNYIDFGILVANYNFWWTIASFAFVFTLHYCYYILISNYRRNSYLKSSIIGIDIDGVLNRHKEKFCEIHMSNMNSKFNKNIPENKKLNPEEIIQIPVSNIKEKDITIDDEFDVFNNPIYWKTQEPIEPNVGKIVKELKNSFGYKIIIHSYRPWPQYEYGELINSKKINKIWKVYMLQYYPNKFLYFGKRSRLKRITKEWLKKNNIPYNQLFLEQSGIDFSARSFSFQGIYFNISTAKFKNRFFRTAKRPYRYFVEDSFENAFKLASTCEYVFLIEHPYNDEKHNKALPDNVIRVSSWVEIKKKIKELG